MRYAMQVEDTNVYFGSSLVCTSKRLMVSFCGELNVLRCGVYMNDVILGNSS